MIVLVVIRWKEKDRIESNQWTVSCIDWKNQVAKADAETNSVEVSTCSLAITHTQHNSIGNLYGLVSIRFDSIYIHNDADAIAHGWLVNITHTHKKYAINSIFEWNEPH